MGRYKAALFIGRFQPFHKGHLYSLKKAIELGEKVIVGVGSSNVVDEKNPWSFEKRKKMVEAVLKQEEIGKEILAIVPIPDYASDEKWAEEVGKAVGKFELKPEQVVGVGNNAWTNEWLEEAGMVVVESGLFNRDELEGVKIRALMEVGDLSYRERVPACISAMLDSRVPGRGK